jgi:predicted aspartyl protease
VDTGFNGALTMRPEIIKNLGLEWAHQSRAELADGTEINFNVYRGFVL